MSDQHQGKGALAITQITYPEDMRFQRPLPPSWPKGESLASILSLVFMTALSSVMLIQLLNPAGNLVAGWQQALGPGLLSDLIGLLRAPASGEALPPWTWVPFAFTVFGAGLGAIFELYLYVTGTPFDQTRSRFTTQIQHVRFANLAPVTTSIFLFMVCLLSDDASTRMGVLFLAGMATTALGMALFFGGAQLPVAASLIGAQLLQAVLVLAMGPTAGGTAVTVLLLVASGLQLISLLTTASTPLKSTLFHLSSSLSGLALYNALLVAVAAQPSLPFDVAPTLTEGSALRWGWVLFSLLGFKVASSLWPVVYNNARSQIFCLIWSVTYFPLLSNGRFPNPINLSSIYKGVRPPETSLAPYWVNHPKHMCLGLVVPSATKVEASALAWKDLVATIRFAVKIVNTLNFYMPWTDLRVMVENKPRMALWSKGEEYWPLIYSMEIRGKTVPGRTLEPTPKPAIAAYKDGTLMAYLCESGIGNAILKDAPEFGEGMLIMDMRDLEQYEVKADYMPYGGAALFRVNGQKQRLELVSVIVPCTHTLVAADPHDPTFRTAEAQILASMYYKLMPGHHLGGIHMTYNLVEVALHNAFDSQGQWAHPYRAFLYLQFFNHELAEEFNTAQLVQDGGVFTQIFGTTHDGLIRFLNDIYRNTVIGTDEDFEERTRLMTMKDGPNAGELLPLSALKWELVYFKIFQRYVDSLLDAIYADDEAVATDRYLQAFHTELNRVFINPLPARYESMCTKKGLARFTTDLIHHIIIRHQTLGTSAGRVAFDPRLNKLQVPIDGGTTGVDEWRTTISMSLATSRSRFTLLLGDFKYLIDGVDPAVAPKMRAAFDQLQTDLLALDAEWTRSADDKQFNFDFFRPLPSDIHTGAGY